MKYCIKCILPDSRPGIILNKNGICSGCIGHELKNQIDWIDRYKHLKKICSNILNKNGNKFTYDAVLPVSGGKDSWYQIIHAKKLGLKVLAITWKTPSRTEIGQINLNNMIAKLNVDHIDYSFNDDLMRKFMISAFEKKGSIGLPMHMAIFSMVLRMAVDLKIPLILWGENSQLEYGGNKKEQLSQYLDLNWVTKHGCMMGTNYKDWAGVNKITLKEMAAFALPSNISNKIQSIFLGSFIKWNSLEIIKEVKKYGFKYNKSSRKTGKWEFADIDCNFISLHHYPKWHKFGMTRVFDNLSIEIRYGRMTRKKAIDLLLKIGNPEPKEDIKKVCDYLGKDKKWFYEICEKYRNKNIWKNTNKKWKIKNFISNQWKW